MSTDGSLRPDDAPRGSASDEEKVDSATRSQLEGYLTAENNVGGTQSCMMPVDWDGPDDPENPRNFSTPKKAFITAILASLVSIVTFGSSVMSPAINALAQEFAISKEVAILVTALFVLGFAFGPMIFGPASEVLGRKYPLSIGVLLFEVFVIPVAVARNVATILVCRFLSGVFGAATLAIAGGALADLWDPLPRGVAVAGFASATFLGPVLGPIVGGFVTTSHLGWRWTQWITLIVGLSLLLVYFFAVPETYSPVLLSRRARRRIPAAAAGGGGDHEKETVAGRDRTRVDLRALARLYIFKPWIMVVQEPILALITLHMGFIYGFFYLSFEAYPVTFEQQRGWSLGVGSLPFLGTTVGVLVGVAIIIVHTKTRMQRKMREQGDVPEERLVPMILGSVLMPIGMFWFGWTSDPDITWVPQVISGAFIGCGILLVFLQGLNYLIDVYKMTANSAISINAMFRGLLGAAFPMFSTYMFDDLGVSWAMSLLGFLCIAMVPVPILFYVYGARIRQWSKFTPY